jgi:hypothetical protein
MGIKLIFEMGRKDRLGLKGLTFLVKLNFFILIFKTD